jgi:hypothetical protein
MNEKNDHVFSEKIEEEKKVVDEFLFHLNQITMEKELKIVANYYQPKDAFLRLEF